MTHAKHALVAFGGNLPLGPIGNAELIQIAVTSIEERGLPLIAMSRLYRTPCFPKGAGPDYVNAVARFAVGPECTPDGVLSLLHDVEAALGRQRTGRWQGRTLDADLLGIGDAIVPDLETQTAWRDLLPEAQRRLAPDQLILPHPRLQDRAFVLVPLCDVAPDWVHPVLGLSAKMLLDRLPMAERIEVQELT